MLSSQPIQNTIQGQPLGFGEQVSYISTGCGALLEYMQGQELPGVAALG